MQQSPDITLEDLKTANDMFDLAVGRLEVWAATDSDVDSFTAGYDVGSVCAFASAAIKLSTRSVLLDAVNRLREDPDLDPMSAVRLTELVTRYFSDREELPGGGGDA